jgi:uncharacterized repeat protein (TIGR03803 family)
MTGNEAVLYSFTGGADGAQPEAGVIRDAAGNLYGTTEAGGDLNLGTVFKLDKTGNETALHSFTGGAGFRGSRLTDVLGRLLCENRLGEERESKLSSLGDC